MRTFLKIVAAMLLLFNGIGAVYGGLHLILHPDGSSIQLSSQWLKTTPFTSYLIPGIVLLVANGLGSVFVFIALLMHHKKYALLVMAQGAILTGWIVIQILMIQTVYFLHVVLGSVGVALILLGRQLYMIQHKGQQIH